MRSTPASCSRVPRASSIHRSGGPFRGRCRSSCATRRRCPDTWVSEHPEGRRLDRGRAHPDRDRGDPPSASRVGGSLGCSPGRTRRAVTRRRTALWVFVWLAAPHAAPPALAGLLVLDTARAAELAGRSDRLWAWSPASQRRRSARGIARGLLAAREAGTPGWCRRTTTPPATFTINWSGRRARSGLRDPLQVVHKALFAPLIITIATNVLFARGPPPPF